MDGVLTPEVLFIGLPICDTLLENEEKVAYDPEGGCFEDPLCSRLGAFWMKKRDKGGTMYDPYAGSFEEMRTCLTLDIATDTEPSKAEPSNIIYFLTAPSEAAQS